MAPQIMWPEMNTDQPTCFHYHRSGSFIANRKYSIVQSDILGLDILFETIRHLLRYEYHFCSRPLFGSRNNSFLSATSLGTIVKTSPIRIAPRAINSSIKRFLILLVRKMISSTVSFSRISNCVFTFTRNNLRNIGESQGLIKSGSRLFLAKLKNANRLVNRARFVWGLRPSVSWFMKSRILSTDRSLRS